MGGIGQSVDLGTWDALRGRQGVRRGHVVVEVAHHDEGRDGELLQTLPGVRASVLVARRLRGERLPVHVEEQLPGLPTDASLRTTVDAVEPEPRLELVEQVEVTRVVGSLHLLVDGLDLG